ncbi:major royal jelly protein 1-like [Chelonus insularis]|uniref:major royal jelly protein 1-like n=1 Tax=Chelonus insularis TaxID=460826 RepID=UPI00158A443D|nr:major royal jelly protein 1-like [Chelonus insularis]
MSPCFFLILSFCFIAVNSAGKFKTVYKWSWIDYLWESETQRTLAILSGEYNYTKPVLIDVDVWKGGKIFVTTIRTDGVPASLTTISGVTGHGGPLLYPYPNWRWARKGDCNGITSVFRVAIDECDRLWVLDTGKINENHVCPAQLLAFDLHTDRLIRRVKIPKSVAQNNLSKHGLLVTPIIETSGVHCSRTYVYMADVTGNGLVIFNGTTVWRLESPVYAPQEIAATVTIANESFYLDDGILGMALSPKMRKNLRYLMFRPLASFDMVSVETTNLQESYTGDPIHYMLVSRALPSQAAAMAFSTEGTLFFGLTHDLAMACWHIDKPITKENIVILDKDENAYQFVSGVKVIPSWITKNHEEVWIVTNRYQKIALETQNFNEINFRIMASSVDKLVDNTNCSPLLGYNFIKIFFKTTYKVVSSINKLNHLKTVTNIIT